MNKIALLIFSFVLFAGISLANESSDDVKLKWITHSYTYGRQGNDCMFVYYNYGTPEFTVNSDDPKILKTLFEACKAGEEDRSSGDTSLPNLLDAFQKNK